MKKLIHVVYWRHQHQLLLLLLGWGRRQPVTLIDSDQQKQQQQQQQPGRHFHLAAAAAAAAVLVSPRHGAVCATFSLTSLNCRCRLHFNEIIHWSVGWLVAAHTTTAAAPPPLSLSLSLPLPRSITYLRSKIVGLSLVCFFSITTHSSSSSRLFAFSIAAAACRL